MASAEPRPLLVEHHGRVRVWTLNRPDRSNCFAPELVAALAQEIRTVQSQPDVHAVVLTGSGRAFCAGLDLKHLGTLSDGGRRSYLTDVLGIFRGLWELPQPVLAAVGGAAVAGGFDMTMFCDLRIAAEDAVFAQTEILLGLNPISTLVHRVVGLGHARELGYTGAKIPATEALRIGLVNHVYAAKDLLPKTLELAQTIALRNPAAVRMTKRLTRSMLDETVDASLRVAGEHILREMGSPEFRDRLAAYLASLGTAAPKVAKARASASA